jgi:hypothetical protein
MTDIDRLRNLHDTRDRIYQKSNVYFTSIWNRSNATQKRWFHGAMDALLDASQAAASFHLAIGANPGANLLACYGFLQAIYVQQDAVLNLCKALQLKWHPNDEERLSDIRNLRNRLCGHPASSDKEASRARPSSAIIPSRDITDTSFRGAIYYDDGFQIVPISPRDLLQENEILLAKQLLKVEEEMDRLERLFRREQAGRLLSRHFGNGFEYLVQGLRYDVSDPARKPQAESHAQMIKEIMLELRNDIGTRGLDKVFNNAEFDRVLVGLELLEQKFSLDDLTAIQKHEFDLVYRGLQFELGDIQKRIDELDEELKTEV